MDDKLTNEIKQWLETPESERDYDNGALLLLKLNGNRIMYNNLSHYSDKKATIIEYNLKKYYNFRVQALTKSEVAELAIKADGIISKRLEKNNQATGFAKGKRADHDSLPEEIQNLFTENLEILQKMRECQTQLRLLSQQNSACKDSERYPFLKELINLDKTLRTNWKRYDHYTPGNVSDVTGTEAEESTKALRMINLNKGKYAKKPTDNLKSKLQNWYKNIITPDEKLIEELKQLGVV